MTNPDAKQAHRDYVSGVLSFYRENDVQPGDPNEGTWHESHYPKPKRLGGTETIPLLEEHHAVQGVLQSEEYECCCVSGLFDRHLRGTEHEELYLKWLKKLGAEGGRIGGAAAWKKRGLKHIEAAAAARSKTVIFEKEGELFTFSSLRKGCAALELSPSAMCCVIKGNRQHHKGFTGYYV